MDLGAKTAIRYLSKKPIENFTCLSTSAVSVLLDTLHAL